MEIMKKNVYQFVDVIIIKVTTSRQEENTDFAWIKSYYSPR